MHSYDILVRGSGCVARSLALALGAQGLRVALLGTAEPSAAQRGDVRSYALNAASVALLRELKVWGSLAADAASPVHEMQIQGDQQGASLGFSAWQQGVSELAFIVDAGELESQLALALRFSPHVQIVDRPVPAALEALCEGRDSQRRSELGIDFHLHGYGQRAIAARLVAAEAHQGIARQWFRSPDVLALLPFERPEPQRSYGLVWSLPEARVAELMALDAAAFEATLCEACGMAPGSLQLASERASWPLAIARAEAMSGPGWVLLGDAAHLVHPLAGQGLNLGLGDVAALARVLAAREPWRPLGDAKLLRRYERERLAPTWAMGELTDGLLKLFASEAAPLRSLRNQGLTLLDSVSPLKRWLTRQALGA
ncbi:FAD-dependent monooxygenase [Paucibacter sp. APW11]|uniref:FAD-dependent monooxygenase n=1 Tax=Roseateles aquae TaxID=3077235 RepID=A0ABU3PF88_9BURK|nr:FAD-dependent monooxygenase [Paucibacter sp. APW11]MDT9001224.1 FAD-dependent monooxygenase [Paucibacter sp. APW11]